MSTSIVILIVIASAVALVADIFSNMIRVAEVREVKRNLRRFEKAFYQYRNEQKKESKSDLIELIVKEEKDALPKFGEF